MLRTCKCGFKVNDFDYCPKCGTDMENVPPKQCNRCGKELCNFEDYCTKCGLKVDND